MSPESTALSPKGHFGSLKCCMLDWFWNVFVLLLRHSQILLNSGFGQPGPPPPPAIPEHTAYCCSASDGLLDPV